MTKNEIMWLTAGGLVVGYLVLSARAAKAVPVDYQQFDPNTINVQINIQEIIDWIKKRLGT